MSRRVGIVAVSPEGAALCYRQIFRHASQQLDPEDHPVVCLHNLPLARYVRAVRGGDWVTVGALLRESAEVLASCGAEVCFTPDNAVQHGVHLAEANSPIPWLNMTELVAKALEADKRQVVGVVGTSVVTKGSAYQTHLGMLGIKVVAPEDEDADALDELIYGELAFGRVTPEAKRSIVGMIERFKSRGCDAVILGCSEAPLVVASEESALPLYDASDILAGCAVRWAMETPGDEAHSEA
ncbi:MAG: amino acid racemase [Phycisphaerales bacterium]